MLLHYCLHPLYLDMLSSHWWWKSQSGIFVSKFPSTIMGCEDIHCHQRMSYFHLGTPMHVLNIKWGGLFISVKAAHPVHTQISVFRWHWVADCPHEWMVSFKYVCGFMVLIVKLKESFLNLDITWPCSLDGGHYIHRKMLFLRALILYKYFL